MKYSVSISKDAKEDLKEIYNYISFKLFSPDTAVNQLSKLEKAIYSLDDMPSRHRIYDKEINESIRFLVVNNYLIFYSINEEKALVDIVRVLYGGRKFNDVL